ncbi:DeoR/GlpR transcriptional regulator [Nakamurella flavida]|uniref:DeoR/GlpR transcriptional regulator n=1 Tax=Nakamurella flavida TaxID=363630 RepID=A0A939C1M5_9ACTN|nr:DeoR/GlpR family DNA-binding transcription regulator [Nakamurella flavida]MBM9477853.1 DeoR/GlpR transcriptional regulator [Nakamurella flavida]MDP9779407.1 DeoR family transcriptional regulator of aga operon [Nakamurella flavida]
MLNRELAEERRTKILEQLYRFGQVRTSHISSRLGVSEVTIRNDLIVLERRGRLVRTHGGAMTSLDDAGALTAFSARMTQQREEKRRIAVAAAEMVVGDETVIFDAGTTTHHLAQLLPPVDKLTVLTPGLNIAQTLMDVEGVEVFVLGGRLHPTLLETVGSVPEMGLSDLPVHKVFLGARGIDDELDVIDISLDLAQVKHRFAKMARQVVLLADSTKWHSSGEVKALALRDVDVVITDSGLSTEDRRRVQDLGVTLVIA